MAAGKFITFEGGEGVGKSTQAALLAGRLVDAGRSVVVTREPGGTPFAEKLRGVLLEGDASARSAGAEAMAFYAARLDHLEQVIRPALLRGDWVICDRFSDSTRVYQGAGGRVSDGLLRSLEDLVVGATQPDLTVVLDIDPGEGLKRVRERSQAGGGPGAGDPFDRYEGRDLAFHTALRDGFLKIAAADPGRCVVVDGGQDIAVIADAVWHAVGERLGVGRTSWHANP